MTYANNTVKCIVGGTLPGGEEFAFGFQLLSAATLTQFTMTELAGQVGSAVTNNLLTSTVKGYYAPTVTFDQVRLYYYNGGTTAALQSESIIGVGGTSANNPPPNQCSVVISLQTGRPGRRYRGRSYMPAPSVNQIGPDTQLSNGVVTALADAYAEMLDALNADTTVDVTAVVASLTYGSTQPITAITVDSKIDTQRRRTKSEAATVAHTTALA